MSRPTETTVETHSGDLYVVTRYIDQIGGSMSTKVIIDGAFLCLIENAYDNRLMIHASAIPELIKALRKAQRTYAKKEQTV